MGLKPKSRPATRSLVAVGAGRRLRYLWIICVLALIPPAKPAAGPNDLAVIVHPQSGVAELTRAEVINIFLGRQRRLPSGVAALTVDLAAESGEKREFYEQLVQKKPGEIQSYWARVVFSGRGAAPWQAENAKEVVSIVSKYEGAIGYVREAEVNEGVRMVYSLTE